jgi:Zn-dependent protease with chaperone function
MQPRAVPARSAEFEARYYDGRNSAQLAVRLIIDSNGQLTVQAPDFRTEYLLRETRISGRLGNSPRMIDFPDGSRCEVADNDRLDAILELQSANRGGWLHHMESRTAHVLLAVALTLGAGAAAVRYGIPWLAEQAAYALPPAVDQRLGQGTLQIMDRTLLEPSHLDQATRSRLRARFAGMTARLGKADRYRLEFRDGGRLGANAFALPSGTVVMTDQLVHASEQDEELVAVLAHELGHLERRHAVRMALQNSAVALLVALVTGDVVSTSTLIAALPTVLVNSSYSRRFENEADDFAHDFLVTSGIPTRHFAAILERISGDREDSTFGHYLSSHPGTRERIARFR